MIVLFRFRCCWLAKSTVACVCIYFPWGQVNLQWQGETIWLITNRTDFTKSSRNLRMMSVHSLPSLEVTVFIYEFFHSTRFIEYDVICCVVDKKWVRHQSCLQDTYDKMQFIQKRLWYEGKNVLFLIPIALRIELRTQEMLKCVWLFSHMFSQRDAINTD